jgi:hypothetical protein
MKRRGARTYFYFRVAPRGQPEFRRPLPHPFDDGYRKAYDAAWREFYGVSLSELEEPLSFDAMTRRHRTESPKYKALSKTSRHARDAAIDLILSRWRQFLPAHIRPLHAQALYDSLADRPATANRRADDASAFFAWGRRRGFCDINPFERIERVKSEGSYEPWPLDALEKLFKEGSSHLVRPALGAIYTGQRRGDLLKRFTLSRIRDGVWYPRQSKTGTGVPIPLHPVMLAIVDEHRAEMKRRAIIDPERPIFENSRGDPWASGYGASWGKEMVRLKLHSREPRLVFHVLRTSNADLIASAVAKSPELFGSIERVKAQLGHLSRAMSEPTRGVRSSSR